jgi:hypothetical protein
MQEYSFEWKMTKRQKDKGTPWVLFTKYINRN